MAVVRDQAVQDCLQARFLSSGATARMNNGGIFGAAAGRAAYRNREFIMAWLNYEM